MEQTGRFKIQDVWDDPSITAIERLNDSVAVVGSYYDNLYLTTNYGQTWNKILLPWYVSLIHDFEYLGGDTIYFVGTNNFPAGN